MSYNRKLSISKAEAGYLTVNHKVYFKVHEDAAITFNKDGKIGLLQDESDYGQQLQDGRACLPVFKSILTALTDISGGRIKLADPHTEESKSKWEQAAQSSEDSCEKTFHNNVIAPLAEEGKLDDAVYFKGPESCEYKVRKAYKGNHALVNDNVRATLIVDSPDDMDKISVFLDPTNTDSSLLNDFPAQVGLEKNKAYITIKPVDDDSPIAPKRIPCEDDETGRNSKNYIIRIEVPDVDPIVIDGLRIKKYFNAEVQVLTYNPYDERTHKIIDSRRAILNHYDSMNENLSLESAQKVLAYDAEIKALNFVNAIQKGSLTEDNIRRDQKHTLKECFGHCNIPYFEKTDPEVILRTVHPGRTKLINS